MNKARRKEQEKGEEREEPLKPTNEDEGAEARAEWFEVATSFEEEASRPPDPAEMPKSRSEELEQREKKEEKEARRKEREKREERREPLKPT